VRTFKATGSRGEWFAVVDGERLPCVYQYWRKAYDYDDPHVSPGAPWPEFIQAISNKCKVVLTSDNVLDPDGFGFERTGYIAVFSVGDVRIEGSHLRFRFLERLAHLK
jgi:hypothetical protein